MSAKRIDPVLVSRKVSRHRFLSLFRVCRYGFESFIRNSWLSVAATAVMTITLLIIFTAVISQTILTDTITSLREKVDISIFLKTNTPDEVGEQLVSELHALPSVRSVEFINSVKARDQFAKESVSDSDTMEAIKEATNLTPATLHVVIQDINDTSELKQFAENSELMKQYLNEDYEPTYAGQRKNSISTIGRAISFAQKVGIIAGLIFVVVSSLIIFNTIRMTIFNRREEIQMMKLIGANQSFIRGPFLIEAIFYGLISAIVATVLGIIALYKTSGTLSNYQISVQPIINYINHNMALVIFAMIVVGALIGVISSLLATRRYLKV